MSKAVDLQQLGCIYFRKADDLFESASMREKLPELLADKLPYGQLDVLIQAVDQLALEAESLKEDWSAERGWLFQLARRLQSKMATDQRAGGGALLAPLALLFIEQVSELRSLPVCEIDWRDREQVELAFESCWSKVRFAEGEVLLCESVELAERDPRTRLTGLRGRVASTCFYLQEANGGKSFFLPVNDQVAELLQTQKTTLSDCIKSLEAREFIKMLKEHVPNRRARMFRFNTEHPDFIPQFKH